MFFYTKNNRVKDDRSIYRAFRPIMWYSVLVGETPVYHSRTSSGELKQNFSEISVIISLLGIGSCSYIIYYTSITRSEETKVFTPFQQSWWFFCTYLCVMYIQSLIYYRERYTLLKLILNENLFAGAHMTIIGLGILILYVTFVLVNTATVYFKEKNLFTLDSVMCSILPKTYIRLLESLKNIYLTAALFICSKSFNSFNYNVKELRDFLMRQGRTSSQQQIAAEVRKLSHQYVRACELSRAVESGFGLSTLIVFVSNCLRWSYIVYVALQTFRKLFSGNAGCGEFIVLQHSMAMIFKMVLFYIPIYVASDAMKAARASIPVIHEVIRLGDELQIHPDTFTHLAIQIDKLSPTFKVCGMFVLDFDFFLVIISYVVTNTVLYLQLNL